jgi:PAS domain S-box-containing protein
MSACVTYIDVFEFFDQPVITTTLDGRVLSWNEAAAALLGVAAHEAVGAPLSELLVVDEPEGLEAQVRAAIDARGWWRGRVSLRAGSDRPASLSCAVTEVLPPGEENEIRVWVARSEGGLQDLAYAARLRQMATQITLAEEQRRREIAEDLHDHLGQGLALVQMRLREMQGNAVFCGLDSQIEEMRTLVEQAIRYTRSLTFELSPPALYEIGLEAALESLAEQLGRKHHLLVGVRASDGLPRLREDLRVILFRSARELLLNVVKHAGASRVTVTIARSTTGVVLTVEDDGRGFAFEATPSPQSDATMVDGAHFGLFSISERLKLLGGHLGIESSPGKGTRATIEVPCT